VFRAQLGSILASLEQCRRLLAANSAHTAAHRYASYEETQRLIARTRRPPLTLEEALRRLDVGDA
jgi:hypothetical protein